MSTVATLFSLAWLTFLPFDEKPESANSVPEHPVVAALTDSQLEPQIKGRVLIEEHRCVSCHRSNSDALVKSSKESPRLRDIGRRANPYFLESFLSAPHSTKPGTTMPEVLSNLPKEERAKTARALTHFLVSLSKGSGYRPTPPDSVAVLAGRELFHTVGCVACHSPRNDLGQETMAATSTPLGELHQKYNVASLTSFLANPHLVRPSGRMPKLGLSRKQYEQIAHYLLQETVVPGNLHYQLIKGRVWEGLDVNVEPVRGGLTTDFDLKNIKGIPQNSAVIYEGFLNNKIAEEVEFFLEWNGGELWINEKQVVQLAASNRRSVKKSTGRARLIDGWNKIKLVYFHTGREPKFKIELKSPGKPKSGIDSSQLSISIDPIPEYQPYLLDSSLVAEGQKAFDQFGCAKCHSDVKPSEDAASVYRLPVSLSDLNLDKGCLANEPSNAPRFAFSNQQIEWIQSFFKSEQSIKLSPGQLVNKSLVTFNCLACHERRDLGGIAPQRNELFRGTKSELGNDGRIPPPLTLVGAKLRKEWMSEVMLNGQRQRDYLATRMPQFGKANVGHLIDLFEQVDEIETVQFEKIEDVKKVKQAGNLLVGTKGFSCIACHDFNGQKAAGPGAMDIIHSTSRLKKDWFYWFMLKPDRFRKGTIMPASWPGGHVFMDEILDSDAKKQIESVWVYLEDGIRAPNPEGLSRKSPELRVTNEALICRGRGTAGYRGLGVGYPERVSLAFDTQEMNLRMIWKGQFANVDNGRFFARGDNRLSFPAGIPFHRLASLDDNWPYKRKTDYLFPQSEGYRFGGYVLDEKRRPTFQYEYGNIQVTDFFEDKLDGQKKPYFQRTLSFSSSEEPAPFYFRIVASKQIKAAGEKAFQADRLNISFDGKATAIVRDGDPKELLLKLSLPKGKSQLILNYKW